MVENLFGNLRSSMLVVGLTRFRMLILIDCLCLLVEMHNEFYLRRTNKEGLAVAKFWFVGSEEFLPCNNDEHFIYCLGHSQVGYPFIKYADLVVEEAIQSVIPDGKVRTSQELRETSNEVVRQLCWNDVQVENDVV
ncbi:hypothetical protein Droror1_Dr00008427 [Drosera rotundifolia]